jgi:UDP-glucose 4-epimerase
MISKHSWYCGKRVVVTGGLGFLGSNLVHALSAAGAHVTVIDSLDPGCGGNPANIASTPSPCRLIRACISHSAAVRPALEGCDVVFNIAGEISHSRSMSDPCRDAHLNVLAHLKFLSTLAECRPGVRVVYAGTRQVYGVPRILPVAEDHPIDPVDFNGIHKHAAETYHALFSRLGELDAVSLRLSNTYGPRMALNVPGQGFLGVFFRLALEGRPITVFEGSQLRDPIFVTDAVDAFLSAGAIPSLPARVFNLGGPEALSLLSIANAISAAAGNPCSVKTAPFPPGQKRYDIGSYVADCSLASLLLSWHPRTTFAAGVRATLDHHLCLSPAETPAIHPALSAQPAS